jgi:Mg-chelatase subunit ChlD
MVMKKKVVKSRAKSLELGKHIVFLLDETGSMMSQRAGAISGFNEFVINMKKEHGDSVGLTLTKFNSIKTETVCVDTKLSGVVELAQDTYKPDGMTPLYDAIASTVNSETALRARSSSLS